MHCIVFCQRSLPDTCLVLTLRTLTLRTLTLCTLRTVLYHTDLVDQMHLDQVSLRSEQLTHLVEAAGKLRIIPSTPLTTPTTTTTTNTTDPFYLEPSTDPSTDIQATIPIETLLPLFHLPPTHLSLLTRLNQVFLRARDELLGLETNEMRRVVAAVENISIAEVVDQGVLISSRAELPIPILVGEEGVEGVVGLEGVDAGVVGGSSSSSSSTVEGNRDIEGQSKNITLRSNLLPSLNTSSERSESLNRSSAIASTSPSTTSSTTLSTTTPSVTDLAISVALNLSNPNPSDEIIPPSPSSSPFAIAMNKTFEPSANLYSNVRVEFIDFLIQNQSSQLPSLSRSTMLSNTTMKGNVNNRKRTVKNKIINKTTNNFASSTGVKIVDG